MTQDGLYWLFSSSAQTIGSFSAFVPTGFALVLAILDGVQARDPSLEEVHTALKRRYHRWLTVLSWITAVAILSSLGLVGAQGFQVVVSRILLLAAAAVNAAALLGGVFFTVSITNPARYKLAARQLLSESAVSGLPGSDITATVFLTTFGDLEKLARRLATASGIAPTVPEDRLAFLPLSALVNGLFYGRVISETLAKELAALFKYRNLIVHGELAAVEHSMFERLGKAINALEEIARKKTQKRV